MKILNFYVFNFFLFLISLTGILINRTNVILILISIELLLLSVNLNFICSSVYLDDVLGEIFFIFVLTVAAAESAIGLALLIVLFRIRGDLSTEKTHLLAN